MPVKITYEDLHMPVAVRLNDNSASGIIGKCERSAMSGKAILKHATIMTDFCIMDLWERSALYGTPEDLVHDPYIFKIVPLPFRTWIYHYYFGDSSHSAKAHGEHGIMTTVLGLRVIDTKLACGAWSPALCGAPAAIVSVMTADLTTVLMALFMCIFNILASVGANSPHWYGKNRLISGGPRFLFFVFLWARLAARASEGAVVILGFLIMLGLLFFDFYKGDLKALGSIAWLCSYRVLKILPNRIFVCRQEGAAFLVEHDHGRHISEIVSGCGYFDELCLIAEVRGLVVQLKPMSLDDWIQCWEQRSETGRPVSFCGLDVFNKDRHSVDEIEKQTQAICPAGAKEALIAALERGENPLQKPPLLE